MANANGTLAGALVIQRALSLVFTKYPVLRKISLSTKDLDTGSPESKYNQTAYTRTKAVPAVAAFGSAATDTGDVDVPITVDQFKQIYHAFGPDEYNATDRKLVDEAATPMAIALGKHMVSAIAAKWLAANFTNATTVASGWTYLNTLLPVRNALSGRGVPGNWFGVVNSSVYGALLGDSTIIAAMNNPVNANAIATGILPGVAGIDLMEYPDLPNTGNMVGFFGSPDSVVVAMRAPANPEEALPGASFPGVLDYVTDPDSGLTVMVNQWIDPATLKANTRLVWMYGVAKGNANNGQILKTA